MTVKDAARRLLLQAAITKRLRELDKTYRAEVLDLWDTGDGIGAQFDGVGLGKVRRDPGATTVSVDDPRDLFLWAMEHDPDAVKEVTTPPSDRDLVAGADALAEYAPDAFPGPAEFQQAAYRVLVAASRCLELDQACVAAWTDALKHGEKVLSRTASDIADDGTETPTRFASLPGVSVKRAPDKLVVSPNYAACAPIVDRVLGAAVLPQIEHDAGA